MHRVGVQLPVALSLTLPNPNPNQNPNPNPNPNRTVQLCGAPHCAACREPCTENPKEPASPSPSPSPSPLALDSTFTLTLTGCITAQEAPSAALASGLGAAGSDGAALHLHQYVTS